MTEFRFGQATDVGNVRQANQDRYFGDGSVFAVADGMGGHSGGEVASGLAVDALSDREQIAALGDLVTLVHRANDRIVESARDDPSLRGMGTTISILAALDDSEGEKRLGIANVGDSRIYRLGEGEVIQLTEDHSLVEALVRDGRLTPEEAGSHPQRNILTRALGIDAKVLVDAWELRAVSGDRYLICSDGLFNELTDDRIFEAVGDSDDPQTTAEMLVERACEAGGRDNVTAVVVEVTAGDEIGSDEQRIVTVRRAVPDRGSSDDAVPEADELGVTESDELGVTESDEAQPIGSAVAGRGRGVLTWRLGLLVAALVIVIVLVVTVVAAYARSVYFVGVEGGDVVIYQGRPGGVLWFDPTVEEPVNVGVVELDEVEYDAVAAGVEFDRIDDAREYGRRLALRVRDDA